MFEDKQSWQDHEMENHWRSWFCQLCSRTNLESRGDLQSHLQASHGVRLDFEKADTMLSAFSRPMENIPAKSCLLCDWELELRKMDPQIEGDSSFTVFAWQFMDHLAGHLEQLALFALPRMIPEATGSDNTADARVYEASSRAMVSPITSARF